MKGDFSRETFDATKHYSGVRMQQGRVQTDADWNEQEALGRRRTQIEARDVLGRCGGPEDDAGFAISVAGGVLRIGAGRYYVDGILCENETPELAYESQPDLPGATPWADALTKAKAAAALVYLDVWERHITPLDDPLLREVALGGPDTATRVKTVWQVRVLPLVGAASDPTKLKDLQAKRAELQTKLDQLIAAGGDPQEIVKIRVVIAQIDAAIAAMGAPPSCDGVIKEWDDLIADPDRRLNARTQPAAPASGPCVVPPTAGYRRLENQLYRVEVHTPGALGTATFKWSRDNGSVVTSIERMSGKDIIVHDLGPDDVLGFASGQWIEVGDDRSELAGTPGQLAQIDSVNSSLRRITLKVAPTPLAAGADGVDRALHPKLRRWDQGGGSATAAGVATSGAWLPLEDGVEVQFGGAAFRTGDYWLIPARTATGEIEWPPFAIPNVAPAAQPPRGIRHHHCRLALLAFDAEKKSWTLGDDCRAIFPPLTGPCCTANALHVVDTNWRNDDLFAAAAINKDGLRIRLDAAPDPASLTEDTVQVAIETPYPDTPGIVRVYFAGTVARDPADDRVIVWRPPTETTKPPTPPTPTKSARKASARVSAASRATSAFAAEGGPSLAAADNRALRVRVTLKGGCIWNDQRAAPGKRIYVDGQAFGQPGVRADNRTPRIALAFPSGDRAKSSDFESWLFVGGRSAPAAFQVTGVRFLNPNEATSSAGAIAPPLAAGQTVSFKAGEVIRVVELTFSRAVLPASVATGAAASIVIEQEVAGQTGRQRLLVDLQPNGNIVRVVLREPPAFKQGKYFLTCVGTGSLVAVVPIVKAADDGSALDGDYDNQPGGNLVLPFTAT